MITKERQAEDVFELSREQLDTLPYGVITLDRRGRILRYNYAEAAFARRASETTVGLGFFTDVAPCTNVQAFKGRFDHFAAGADSGVDRFDFTFAFRWGSQDVSITLLRKRGREEINLIVRGRATATLDVVPRADDAAATRAGTQAPPRAEILDGVGESAPAGVGTQRLKFVKAWELGSAPELAWRATIHPDDAQSRARIVTSATARRKPYAVEYRTIDALRVQRIVVECGSFAGGRRSPGYATLVDVTERRARERELWQRAHYDGLTGLPNRDLLLERISTAAAEAVKTQRLAGIIALAVAPYDAPATRTGRATGEELLKLVALRLGEVIRGGDTVARLDGETFVVLLTDMASIADVATGAARIATALAQPFALDGRAHRLVTGIGVSVTPRNGTNPVDLLRAAETALEASSANGRHGIEWFSSEMTAELARDVRVEDELRIALQRDELVLFYQPIIDVETGRMVAVEALVRWKHPVRGLVMPGDFISVAERAGLIDALGAWVLLEACRQARAWLDEGFDLHVCVNVSTIQFRQHDFVASVLATLAQTRLPTHLLELELTESVMVDGFNDVIETLTKLKVAGVRLAIDDFGTGYSSLSYLKYFPIDTLKIDRAFVADIANDAFDRAIARTVLTLADELGLHCIAEGVENSEQLERLRSLGCRRVQGYFFSRPQLPADLRARLSSAPVAL